MTTTTTEIPARNRDETFIMQRRHRKQRRTYQRTNSNHHQYEWEKERRDPLSPHDGIDAGRAPPEAAGDQEIIDATFESPIFEPPSFTQFTFPLYMVRPLGAPTVGHQLMFATAGVLNEEMPSYFITTERVDAKPGSMIPACVFGMTETEPRYPQINPIDRNGPVRSLNERGNMEDSHPEDGMESNITAILFIDMVASKHRMACPFGNRTHDVWMHTMKVVAYDDQCEPLIYHDQVLIIQNEIENLIRDNNTMAAIQDDLREIINMHGSFVLNAEPSLQECEDIDSFIDLENLVPTSSPSQVFPSSAPMGPDFTSGSTDDIFPTMSPTLVPSIILMEPPVVEPLDASEWDALRYLGLALFCVTVLGTLLVRHLAIARMNRRTTHEAWGNLASEEGVAELLRMGWKLEGTQMEIFDKAGWGYRDDDSIFMGGYEPKVGEEITVTPSETIQTPNS